MVEVGAEAVPEDGTEAVEVVVGPVAGAEAGTVVVLLIRQGITTTGRLVHKFEILTNLLGALIRFISNT